MLIFFLLFVVVVVFVFQISPSFAWLLTQQNQKNSSWNQSEDIHTVWLKYLKAEMYWTSRSFVFFNPVKLFDLMESKCKHINWCYFRVTEKRNFCFFGVRIWPDIGSTYMDSLFSTLSFERNKLAILFFQTQIPPTDRVNMMDSWLTQSYVTGWPNQLIGKNN